MGMCCVVRWIISPCFGLHFIVMSRAVTPIHCAVCPVLPVPWILFFILLFFSVSILLIFQFLIKMMCLLSFHMICLTFFSFSLTYNLPCFFFFFLPLRPVPTLFLVGLYLCTSSSSISTRGLCEVSSVWDQTDRRCFWALLWRGGKPDPRDPVVVRGDQPGRCLPAVVGWCS